MANSEMLRAQYGRAGGPVVASTLIRTGSEKLNVAETTIDRGDVQMPIYAAKPETEADLPVVLVLCEAFGLNEHTRDIARRFAHEGYLAIAPDLMKRQGDPLAFEDFNRLLHDVLLKIPDDQVSGDLDACVKWAHESGGGHRGKLAITGFCWGGRWAWLYAAQRQFAAAVAWYGLLDADSNEILPQHSPLFPEQPIDLTGGLRTPVLGLYGARDPAIPMASIEAMKHRLTQGSTAARRSEILTYPEAGHAFFADYRESYEPAAARDGWKRCLEWIHGALNQATLRGS
jgi:carboxymethylenebutenolidase